MARSFFADLATYADPPGPENATDLLARLPLQAIIYAWTVGSYLLGTTGEEELLRRVEQHSNGIPVLMSAPAATAAFRALEAERIALILDAPAGGLVTVIDIVVSNNLIQDLLVLLVISIVKTLNHIEICF